MIAVTIEEAQAMLPELIRQHTPGVEVEITSNGTTVAKLVTVAPVETKKERKLGTMRGTVLSMEHFDDPIEGLEEYS
ncbi:MAG: type II toxin-antitoxin system prevent-host-death family antitoxin [Bacteroidales bacterium]|nr:type II toxin-antitoxin system prevent-host-death family antitoxin [Bacteroidales bacterium]